MKHDELAWAMARLQWYEINMPEMSMAEKFRAVLEELEAINHNELPTLR